MRTTAGLATLSLVLLLAPGCLSGPPGRGVTGLFQSGWEFEGEEGHPSLDPRASLVSWTRGSGPTRERRWALRVRGKDLAVTSSAALHRYCHPLDLPTPAHAYPDLVRRLGADSPTAETAILYDAELEGRGGNGVYGPADIAAWNDAPAARPTIHGGGLLVETLVLIPPIPHEELPRSTPWRLVIVREVVRPDGTLQRLDERTLTNGEDAARYARY